MTTTYKFITYDSGVKSTVLAKSDGSLKEVDGWRRCTEVSDTPWSGPGTVYPTLDDWVSAMELEARKRRPWYQGRESWTFSYCPADTDKCSTMIWMPCKKHYMEIRRGKCSEEERRIWATVRQWVEEVNAVRCSPRLAAKAAASVPVRCSPRLAAKAAASVPIRRSARIVARGF